MHKVHYSLSAVTFINFLDHYRLFFWGGGNDATASRRLTSGLTGLGASDTWLNLSSMTKWGPLLLGFRLVHPDR